eukprot:TRINITY_DN1972_c0_g2_i1.p1 TRINITY_DN1972_c0_g2~~TRINITY_DN1972_c0_g2_i1.p1  ORF type:complete len:687 (-),score=104.17 TRINITY_DN1972_c0_g2_i1:59-1993(-)
MMTHHRRIAIARCSALLFLFACFSLFQACAAADLYVSTSTGSDLNTGTTVSDPLQTIQTAAFLANDGDTVQILPGIYTGTGNTNVVTFGKAITIRAYQMNIEQTVISCGNSLGVSAFLFVSGETRATVLEFVTMINCTNLDGGAIVVSSSSPTIRYNYFALNSAAVSGGAVGASGIGTLVLHGNTFEGNQAVSLGGAVSCTMDEVEIIGNTFITNGALGAGGALNIAGSEGLVHNNTFIGNQAENGAAMAMVANNIVVSECIFTQNSAIWGTILMTASRNVLYSNLTFFNNNIGQVHGIRLFYSENIIIEDSLWDSNNVLGYFGSISTEGCKDVLLRRNVFRNTRAAEQAGHWCRSSQNITYEDCMWDGIESNGASVLVIESECELLLRRCTIQNCVSVADDGTISMYINTNVTIEDSVIQNNTAGRGGAIVVRQGSILDVSNTLFVDNTALGAGGAISIETFGSLPDYTLSEVSFKNCDFEGNRADGNGGAFWVNTEVIDKVKGITNGNNGNKFKRNRGEIGGAVYVHDDGGYLDEYVKCDRKDCKKNDAGTYGEDFASSARELRFTGGGLPNDFRNLESFDTEVEVVDSFENRVKGEVFVITPKLSGNKKKKATLIDASSSSVCNSLTGSLIIVHPSLTYRG